MSQNDRVLSHSEVFSFMSGVVVFEQGIFFYHSMSIQKVLLVERTLSARNRLIQSYHDSIMERIDFEILLGESIFFRVTHE